MAEQNFGGAPLFVAYPPAIRELLQGRDGPVVRSLISKAIRVTAGAKRRCPVDTGRLRQSIRWELGRDGHGYFVRVGSDLEYAAAVHDGHGDIYPKNARVLHFFVGGEEVFTMHVGPTQGVPFLRDALDDIRGL